MTSKRTSYSAAVDGESPLVWHPTFSYDEKRTNQGLQLDPTDKSSIPSSLGAIFSHQTLLSSNPRLPFWKIGLIYLLLAAAHAGTFYHLAATLTTNHPNLPLILLAATQTLNFLHMLYDDITHFHETLSVVLDMVIWCAMVVSCSMRLGDVLPNLWYRRGGMYAFLVGCKMLFVHAAGFVLVEVRHAGIESAFYRRRDEERRRGDWEGAWAV